MTEPRFEPRALRWLDAHRFEVTWEDGHVSVLSLDYLRANCPCAGCAGYGPRQIKPLPPFHVDAEQAPPVVLAPVGDYAIGIRFTDGHNEGIFAYRFLRFLCPCDACEAMRAVELGQWE
jgi:DUF971 family protein